MSPDDSESADVASFARAEFAFPGPLRDQLVESILSGEKTSTTSLELEFEVENEPLPQIGGRSVLVDSEEEPVAIVEVTGVRIVSLGEVDLAHVRDEGEGHQTLAEWRTAHERFFHSQQMRRALNLPDFTVVTQHPWCWNASGSSRVSRGSLHHSLTGALDGGWFEGRFMGS